MRITYIYRHGRKSRLDQTSKGPSEFFYGYQELCGKGVDVELLEDADLGMAAPLALIPRLLGKLSTLLGGLPISIGAGFVMGRYWRRLNRSGCLVATTNGMGLALAFVRAFGQLRPPVVLLAMGLLPQRPSQWQVWLYSRLTRHLRIICISKVEAEFLRHLLQGQSVYYIPFGVDQKFWTPGSKLEDQGDYVLAIGNDPARDWETLVKAWRPDFPRLKIVTHLTVPAHDDNIEVVCGDWRSSMLSDEDVRVLYRGARFVVIPLCDTIQPSGQSVCLQAMACGKAVILTDIAGIWDRELIVNNKSVLLTPPKNPSALTECVRRLVVNTDLALRIGAAGRKVIEEHLNTDNMAQALDTLIRQFND